MLFWSAPVSCSCAELLNRKEKDEPSGLEYLSEVGVQALARQITPPVAALAEGISRQISPRSALKAPGSPKVKRKDAQAPSDSKESTKVKVKFDYFDTDKSGVIEYNEFTHMLSELMKSRPGDLTPKLTKKFWQEADKNADSEVDLSEFSSWYLKYFNLDDPEEDTTPAPKPQRQISTTSYVSRSSARPPRQLSALSDEYAMVPLLSSNASEGDILLTSDDLDVLFEAEEEDTKDKKKGQANAVCFGDTMEAPMEIMIKTLSVEAGTTPNVAKALQTEAEAFISRVKGAEPATFKLRGVSPSGFEWGAEMGGSTFTQISRGTIQHAATHLVAANLDVSSPGGSVLSQPSILGLQKNLEAVKNLGPVADNKLDCMWQVTSTGLYTKLSGKKVDEALRVSIIDMRTSIVVLVRSDSTEEQNFIGVLIEPRADGGVLETMLCQRTVPQAFRYLWRMTPSAALRRAFTKDVEQLLVCKNALAARAAANEPAQSKWTPAPAASAGKVKDRPRRSSRSSKGSEGHDEQEECCPNGHALGPNPEKSVHVACEVCKKYHAAKSIRFCQKCGYQACSECHAFYVVWTSDRSDHRSKARNLERMRNAY